ncbi:hypothetical protein CI238_13271, partial [Colletotrichum incanum]
LLLQVRHHVEVSEWDDQNSHHVSDPLQFFFTPFTYVKSSVVSGIPSVIMAAVSSVDRRCSFFLKRCPSIKPIDFTHDGEYFEVAIPQNSLPVLFPFSEVFFSEPTYDLGLPYQW